MQYIPKVGEILELTNGTRIVVKAVYSDHFGATPADTSYFSREETGKIYHTAFWMFDGTRGPYGSEGLSFVIPDPRIPLEAKVKELGGEVTWTNPVVLQARQIWVKYANPSFFNRKEVLKGDYDTGAVMCAIIEALNTERNK